MPFLYCQAHTVSFGDIKPGSGEMFPFAADGRGETVPPLMQQAAALIYDWQQGRDLFHIHTSGSTGIPKIISLERDKIIFSANQTAQAFGLQEGDTLLCCLGLNYIAGFMMVMRALVLGCHLVLEEPAGDPLSRVDKGITPDFASFVPLQMETMLADGGSAERLNRMKAILVGGGPVAEPLEQKIQKLTVPVYHTYAMTETYTHVAVRLMNGPGSHAAYNPLPGTTISTDDRGCLVIESYLTDHKPLLTNDLAEILPDGSFLLHGRADNVINSGGVKIQAEKVEAAAAEAMHRLNMHASRFFAAGLPDEKLGQKLVLIIEGKKWQKADILLFTKELAAMLGKYELPKEMIFTDSISLTSTGKIDRTGSLKNLDLL